MRRAARCSGSDPRLLLLRRRRWRQRRREGRLRGRNGRSRCARSPLVERRDVPRRQVVAPCCCVRVRDRGLERRMRRMRRRLKPLLVLKRSYGSRSGGRLVLLLLLPRREVEQGRVCLRVAVA